MIFLVQVICAVIALAVIGGLTFSYLSCKSKLRQKEEESMEREVVSDLLITNFVPEPLKPQIKSYMLGYTRLEELQEVMASMVKPGSGFIKYAQHVKKEK